MNIYLLYMKGDLLGRGAFSECYEFIKKGTNEIEACKIISKENSDVVHEISIHKTLSHENIVQFNYYMEDLNYYYIFLEMCDKETLGSIFLKNKLTEYQVAFFMNQVINGLIYLHNNNIVHTDLKIDNIFIKNMQVKIGDFGLSFDNRNPHSYKMRGTPNYLSPEMVKGQSVSFEIDIWAIGIIIYLLLIGIAPFETNSYRLTINNIRNNIWSFPEKTLITNQAKALIKDILILDPKMRPSLLKIQDNPFFDLTKYEDKNKTFI